MDDLEEDRHLDFRKRCLDELLSSEESYLNHLSLLKEHFVKPVLEKSLLPINLFGCIFGNVTSIQTINMRLYEELRRHYATDTIGQSFIAMAPYLKIYATYAKNLEQAQLSLKNYETKNKDFKTFREFQEWRPEMNGLKLNSLLITPIQRVPRYKLLLHEIISYTPQDHQDYNNLIEAEKAIGDVARHINDHVNQTTEIQEMLSLQRALTKNRPRIFTPGRSLIKQGVVKKLSRRGNGEQKRVLILFSDMIIYCKLKHSDITKPESLECCCVLPLIHCSVILMFGVIFKLCCKEEEILFYCNSVCECNMWVEKIETAIRMNCENTQTLKKVTSSRGPLKRKMLLKQRIDSLSVIVRERARKRAKHAQPNNISQDSLHETPPPCKKSRLPDIMEEQFSEEKENDPERHSVATLLSPCKFSGEVRKCNQRSAAELAGDDDEEHVEVPEHIGLINLDNCTRGVAAGKPFKNSFNIFSCSIL